MLVVDLGCAQGHRFEGWFASGDELERQRGQGLLACPVCGDHAVQRLPSAPRLNVSHLDESAQRPARGGQGERGVSASSSAHAEVGAPSPEAAEAAQALQAMYWSAVRHVMQHTEDVGERFANEARAMHHGEVPAKPIRGQLDEQEREALKDEGIEVMTLVVPKGLDGPVQ